MEPLHQVDVAEGPLPFQIITTPFPSPAPIASSGFSKSQCSGRPELLKGRGRAKGSVSIKGRSQAPPLGPHLSGPTALSPLPAGWSSQVSESLCSQRRHYGWRNAAWVWGVTSERATQRSCLGESPPLHPPAASQPPLEGKRKEA